MQTVKIALIGCGAVTLKAHLPALMNDPTAKLSGYQYRIVAVASLDSENLSYIQEILPWVKVYGDYQQLLKETVCDAVLVATGEALHPTISREALEMGKFVLCEKPLGASTIEIRDDLSPLSPELVNRLQIAFNKRFYPVYATFREYQENSKLGNLICGSYQFLTQQGRKSGWDGILSNLIHYCDLISAIHGNIVEVEGKHRIDATGLSIAASMRSETGAVINLLFTSSASWKAAYHEEWQLIDENRNRYVARNANESCFFRHDGISEVRADSNSIFWLPDAHGYRTQLKSFYDLVCGARAMPEVGLLDALNAQDLVERLRSFCGSNV